MGCIPLAIKEGMMRVIVFLMVLTAPAAATMADDNPLERLEASADNDAELLVRLGNLYVEANRLDEAKKAFKQAKRRGDNPEARFGLIKIHMAQNKFQQAKFFCRKLTKDHPKLSSGDVCSGWFWLGNARSSRAIEEFEKAITKGDVARGKTGIAEAQRRLAKYDEALAAYKEALAAGADYLADLGLGLVLEKRGDSKGAVAALTKAVEKEPASCLAHFHLGRLLGNTPKAVEELRLAAAIRPRWYEAYVALGDTFEQSGRIAEATQAYEKAVDAEPARGDAHYGLARVLHKQGKLDEALVSLQKVVDAISNHAGAYLMFAEIYYEKKEPDQAIEALDRARGVASGDTDVLVRSAEIYMELGRFTNARAFLTQVISMKPQHSKAHGMLGDIACERKRYDEGKKHYDMALKGDLKGIGKADIKKKLAACRK